MRYCSLLACIVLLALNVPAIAQTGPTRDPQAVLLVQKSVAAMGGVAPSDSTATGTITLVAGWLRYSATFAIPARRLKRMTQEAEMSRKAYRASIYSARLGNRAAGSTNSPQHFGSQTAGSPIFRGHIGPNSQVMRSQSCFSEVHPWSGS